MRQACSFLALAMCLAAGAARADDKTPAKPAASSLDDELLKGLGGDPVAELAPQKPASKSAVDGKPANNEPANNEPSNDKPIHPAERAKRKAAQSLDDELLKGLEQEKPPAEEAAAAGESDNPLSELNRLMREVEQRMRAGRADEETITLHREIVRKLDELIKQAEQSQQQSSSSNSAGRPKPQGTQPRPQQQPKSSAGQTAAQKPSEKPASDSSEKLTKRKPQQADMAQVREMLKDIWGELPPRLRQQMMQSSVEKFVPKYELLIEDYFKTLADEQARDRR
ncbi:MAG TPA: hypothetical protein VHZ24_21360 [Pirellulales bacterium]|jgi:hypothetical protein|nr:hypothetical protein [Pirellulales bacterium]